MKSNALLAFMQTDRKWRYLAEGANGDVARGVVEAADQGAAVSQLRARGLLLLDLEPEGAENPQFQSSGDRGTKLSHRDATLFCQRMADLLTAGVPAIKALQIIGDQTDRSTFSAFVHRLHGQLRAGKSLSAALTADPAASPPLMQALVASGEALGDLGGQFAHLAHSFEARAALRKEIAGQLIYPAALFVLIIVTIIFLSFMVLPQFETVFANAAAPPPPETRAVLAVGAFIRDQWLLMAVFICLGVAAINYALRHHKRRWERILLSMPLIGTMVRKFDTARYCRGLGELLEGGMPLARAMPIARGAIANQHIRQGVKEIEDDVRNGVSLSRAAKQSACLDRDALSFIEIGEETGALARMISKAADYLENQIASRLKRFAALSGPIMTAIMGLITAGVIAAVMTGVLSLNEAIY